MAGAPATWQQLMGFLEANGLEPGPTCRENYVSAEGDDQSDWVVELPEPGYGKRGGSCSPPPRRATPTHSFIGQLRPFLRTILLLSR